MWKKFRPDYAAHRKKYRKKQTKHRNAYCDYAMLNGPPYGFAVESFHKFHNRVVPLASSFLKKVAGKNRRNKHRKQERAKQRERDGPSHRFEQAAFNALQRKNRQVGGDNDNDCIEDRTLHFVRGFTNTLHRRFVGVIGVAEVADDV